MKVFLDIGCHLGYYGLMWANDQNNMVYAFEPVPSLYEKLKEEELNFPNFKVFPFAISEVDGQAVFNVNDNLATCSLKEFTDKNNSFHTEQKITVQTKRLDTFMREMNIDKVYLLKSDAQGSDLEVVKGLGSRINDVEQIMIEAFITSQQENIYVDEVKKSEVFDFLIPLGYELTNEQIDGNYVDLTFKRKS
jgi:FkbM family methyltransferase